MENTPFSCTFSPSLPAILHELGISIALSTYQAGKVIFVSAPTPQEIVQLPRSFDKAMGIAVAQDRLAVALRNEVLELRASPDLAHTYPRQPATYDTLYLPRATYYTGQVDIHDLHFGEGTLWAVNTSFSCLVTIDAARSFTPRWTPPFISALASEDRCHLNGMAMYQGKPRYATALGQGDTPQSWRESIREGGVLMDVPGNRIVAEGLPMPHSPRIHNGYLYLLFSATGVLAGCPANEPEHLREVAHLGRFVRGMACHGDFLFIGTSLLRKSSKTFEKLDFGSNPPAAGFIVFHLPTQAIVAWMEYQSSVEEIFDVQVILAKRPNILNTLTEVHHQAIHLDTATYWAKQPDPAAV